MQVRPVNARAVRCGELWVLEIPSLSIRVPTEDLEDSNDAVTSALTRHRRRPGWVVQVQIISYLHVDDLPEGRRRSVLGAARMIPPSKSEGETA